MSALLETEARIEALLVRADVAIAQARELTAQVDALVNKLSGGSSCQ